MIAIKIGTTSWRQATALEPDEVEFLGAFAYEGDGLTPAMVWDAAIGNVRPRTAAEEQAVLDAKAAAGVVRLQEKAGRQELKDNFQQWKDKLVAVRDEVAWTNAKRDVALKDLAQVQLKMLAVLKGMVTQ